MRRPRDLPAGALAPSAAISAVTIAALAAAAPMLLGCGPVEYINQVGNKAAAAVSAAKLAQADHYAPYEYTAAEEYLHKAREEAGYAQYQDAIDYGRKSEELANRARAIAVTRLSQGAGAPATAATGAAPAPERASERPKRPETE